MTAIDVSANTKLEDLTLSYNQLTEIDVSHNLLLHQLACDENPLTELDVSTNKELERLICGETMLTSLDVSNNPKLEWLYCQNNVYTIEVLDGQAFNMTSLPGTFDKTKAGEFSAGSYRRTFQIKYCSEAGFAGNNRGNAEGPESTIQPGESG